MPKFDVTQTLHSIELDDDGNRKPFRSASGTEPCVNCGFEHGTVVREDMSLGLVLKTALSQKPDGDEKKGKNDDCVEDMLLALDVEMALKGKADKNVKFTNDQVASIQKRLKATGFHRFVIGVVNRILEQDDQEAEAKPEVTEHEGPTPTDA